MDNYTINTYEMKRDIVKYSEKICEGALKPESKFTMNMIYGIAKSKNIHLSAIAEALNENIKKSYTINRLSDNLTCDLDDCIDKNYLNLVIDALGTNPIFIVDDSDVIKPLGEKFEHLGIVRDGSSRNKTYEKGYHHTEIVGLTQNNRQPISVYSKLHSSESKEYISANDETFKALDKVIDLLDERNIIGTFVNDRGYDNNKIFNYYFRRKQNFIIRLKENRVVYLNHRWKNVTTLRDSRKGKVKLNIFFQGENKECYASALRVQITAKKEWINLILVYGLGETPMMLVSNIPLKSKEDLIKTVRCYIDRWKIEEYFKFKKQEYNFEDFRVRSLKSINNLNKMLTYTIGLIALLSEKINKQEFVNRIIKESKSLRDKVYMYFYQLSRGIYNILKMARTGIKDWQHISKTKEYNGQLSLL